MPIGAGLALAGLFWFPLFLGGGFVGGDVYNYFMPLKTFYAEGLAHGTIHWWHPRIGNGVPVVGESQTGAFYPFYLAAYALLDVNSAYNAVFLVHYLLAFLFTYWLAREVGVGGPGRWLAAIVFVFGWFPPRSCLEWGIVTGAWLPLSVWSAIRWLKTGQVRWFWVLAGSTCVQLLAGHFQLAFVTLLAVLAVSATCSDGSAISWGRRATVPLLVGLGFLLAAPQLLPTWELKQRSQRDLGTFSGTVAYGHVPLEYLAGWIVPFYVYPNAEGRLRDLGDGTNKIEAHLYFGLMPLALVLAGMVRRRFRRSDLPWITLAVVGIVLALGWPFAFLAHVPGFNFFRYPGRYGLMAQLGMALLAGRVLDDLGSRNPVSKMLSLVLLAATVFDFWWVGRQVQYVRIVYPPVIDWMEQSPVFEQLGPTDRVLAIDGNTLALSRSACVPPYLGMGPASYYAIWERMPDLFHGKGKPTEDVLRTLRETGVTHVLTELPFTADWPMTLLWSGFDPFLHRRWGRQPNEPLWLYRYDDRLGRAYLRSRAAAEKRTGTQTASQGSISRIEILPERVTVDCTVAAPDTLVLTDLDYPGWRVLVDGRPADPDPVAEPFRAVRLAPGEHRVEWRYTPWSLYTGFVLSAFGLAILVALSLRRRSASSA